MFYFVLFKIDFVFGNFGCCVYYCLVIENVEEKVVFMFMSCSF